MLHKLQSDFCAALFTGDDQAAAAQVKAGSLGVARRLAIYRHNVHTNLLNALGDIYPVIYRILGGERWQPLAQAFITTQPSPSGDLNDFGAAWPAWLQQQDAAQALPYLPDVAKLEWAWHRAFHAADYPRFDLASLAAISVEDWSRLQFALHPSLFLLQSDFPVTHIWRINQPDYTGPMSVDWGAGGETLWLVRDGFEVAVQRCSAATHAFIHALQQGGRLEVAVEAACLHAADFDLQATLMQLIQTDTIIHIIQEEA